MVKFCLKQQLKRKRNENLKEKPVECEESENEPTSRKKKRRVIIEDEEKSESAVESEKNDFSEESSQEDDESDYEVEQIIDKRIEKNGTTSYKVKWRDYSPIWNQWIPEKDCACPELIEEFEKNTASKSSTQKIEFHQKSPSPGTSTSRSTRVSSHSTEKSSKELFVSAAGKTQIKGNNGSRLTCTSRTPGQGFSSSPKRNFGSASPNPKKIAEKASTIVRKKEVIQRNEIVGHGISITKTKEANLLSISTDNDIEQRHKLNEGAQNGTSETSSTHSIETALNDKRGDDRSNIHNALDGEISSSHIELTRREQRTRKAEPIFPVRKLPPTMTSEGLFVLTSKRVLSTAGLPPKEREALLARQNREAQLEQERAMVTVHPTPSEKTSTALQETQPPPLSKQKRVPPPLPKMRPPISTENLLLKEKEAEENTQATSITSPNDSETFSDNGSKQYFNLKTVAKPTARVSDERSNSTISNTRKEPVERRKSLNIKEVSDSSNELEDGLLTNRGNEFEKSSIVKREVEMSEKEMDTFAEERWKKEQEKRRREQLAERQKEAEKQEKRLEKKKQKETQEKEKIYDPRATSPVSAEIYDPRAVANHEQRIKARSEPTTEEPDRPCLLDRGIKIERIVSLFYIEQELMGLCRYMNCLEEQIVSVKKIKQLDPVALIHAYEALFWDNKSADDLT